MFERFSPESRAVMVEALALAQELGSRSIGAGHVLYGCAEGRGDLRARSARCRPRPACPPSPHCRPPLTPEAKRSLQLALRAAQELHHHTMRPGHLLLGLLRLDSEVVSRTVEWSDTDLAGLSAMVLTRLSAA